jgi:hypothetical protein
LVAGKDQDPPRQLLQQLTRSGNSWDLRLNGTNDHPPFQGFQLTDPMKIESKEKIDAMSVELGTARSGVAASHGTVRDPRISLYPTFFDPSHGVPSTEWALGSPAKGGCLMCHSSSNPSSPSYSPYSVGFFDSEKELLQNGMMQMANADCDNPYLFNMMTTGDPYVTHVLKPLLHRRFRAAAVLREQHPQAQ